MGIKDESVEIPIIDYVLSEIKKADYPLFAEAADKAAEAAKAFASGNSIDLVMNRFNG